MSSQATVSVGTGRVDEIVRYGKAKYGDEWDGGAVAKGQLKESLDIRLEADRVRFKPEQKHYEEHDDLWSEQWGNLDPRRTKFPHAPGYGMRFDGHVPIKLHDTAYLAGLGELVTGWEFPHQGDATPGCGDFMEWRAGVNEDRVHAWPQVARCGARTCPACGPIRDEAGKVVTPGAWEVRAARRAADQIEGHLLDITSKWRIGQNPNLMHIAISPPRSAWNDLPQEDQTSNRLANLRRTAIRYLKSLGVQDGYIVLHSHRIPGRFNDRHEAEEGLHFHAICLHEKHWRPFLPGQDVKKLHERTGWVVKNIQGKDDGEVVPEARDAFGTILYLLSHATWPRLSRLVMPAETIKRRVKEARSKAVLDDQGNPKTETITETVRKHGHMVPHTTVKAVRKFSVISTTRVTAGGSGLLYPAWSETSTQAKALIPFGRWCRKPDHVVETPLEENTCPTTGVGFREEAMYDVKFDGRKPHDPDGDGAGFVIPRKFCLIDHVNRRVTVQYDRWRGRASRPRPPPDGSERPPGFDPVAWAERKRGQLQEEYW